MECAISENNREGKNEDMNSQLPLSGRTALVTGGGVGIGRAIAEELAELGATVIATYLTHPVSDWQDANTHNGAIHGMKVDATSETEVASCVAEIAEKFGPIDILINNVGGLINRHTIAEMSFDHWRTVLSVNLDSMFLFTHYVLPHMTSGWGRIVNISSLAGRNGGGNGSTAYAATKSAVLGFTRGLAKEVAGDGVTVNAVAPGLILDTPFHESFTPLDAQQSVIESLPVGRAGYPKDVSSAVGWLCSPGSGFTTGAVMEINGGQYFS